MQNKEHQTAHDGRLLEDREANHAQMERIESWFDSHAQEWSDLYRRPQRVNDIILTDRQNAAVAFLCNHLSPGSRVLDVGCGAGLTALELVHKGYIVHGVDISQKMINLCEENFAKSKIPRSCYVLTRSDVIKTSLPEGTFDGIVALGFLQYQPMEHPPLQLFHKLLKPGGIVVISGPIRKQIANYFGLLLSVGSLVRKMRILKSGQVSAVAQHRYSLSRFRTLLRRAGFELIDHKGHGFADYEIIGRLIGFEGELFLHRFFTWLSGYLPIGRWGNDLIVVAKRKQ